jgi:cyclopropane fatty-acyl-phospholipid synthase-like methyltransferase
MFLDLDLYHDSYDAFLKQLEKGQAKVLEIGCGPGMICKYLLQKKPQLQVLGTDIAENMLQLAQKNNPDAQFQLMDCRHINSIDSTFDGIIGGFVLPYLSPDDISKLVRDSFSLLCSKGFIYVSFIEGDHQNSGFIKGSSGDSTYVYYYEDETIIRILTENHFQIIRSFKKEFFRNNGQQEIHLIIIAQKAS